MSDDAKTKAEPKGETRTIAPFKSMQDEIERLFHAFSLPEVHWPGVQDLSTDTLGLRMDVSESDTAIQVTAELPGVKEEHIDVSLDGTRLRISATKSAEEKKDDKTWHVTERSFGKLERTMHVPPNTDPEAIKAVYKDGVLTIDIPKPADAGAPSQRKISVKSA